MVLVIKYVYHFFGMYLTIPKTNSKVEKFDLKLKVLCDNYTIMKILQSFRVKEEWDIIVETAFSIYFKSKLL